MPAVRAERLCPDAIFVRTGLHALSRRLEAGARNLSAHTDLVEPLSLDEAYLDVTEPKTALPVGDRGRRRHTSGRYFEETQLTASAGVAPNKFLAKIASDWRKPNGLFVIRPHEVEAFLAPLPVARIPGVGKVMEARLDALGIHTCADLRAFDERELARRFGRLRPRLHELASASTNVP